MAGDLSFEKRTKRELALFYYAPAVNRPSGHGNLLATDYKITRSDRSGFQSKDCKAKCQIDHD